MMRALTLHRPWPWAIFHASPERAKRVENRGWHPPAHVIGQDLAIHAGLLFDRGGADFIHRLNPSDYPDDDAAHPTGVIGIVRVTGCRSQRFACGDSWWFGPHGWAFDRVRALPAPIPCRGAQGLWVLPPEVERKVHDALGARRSEVA